MQYLSGFDYLLIDAANQAGLDKLLWDQRTAWAMDQFDQLESIDTPAKERPLFLKAVMAIRDAQRGKDTGHLVGLDACCSGMQIMSAVTGCIEGAKATNLINTGIRQDAYGLITTTMQDILQDAVNVTRSDAKNAQMTHLYASKAEPRALFGEDTPALAAFYEANWIVCPGANELLADLLTLWQPFALQHAWKLPDNFHAIVKVMQTIETRIEVDELDHASCTYEYAVNEGKESGINMPANVIHSIDAYILRSMQRRCGYDPVVVDQAMKALDNEWSGRLYGTRVERTVTEISQPHHVYMERFEASGMVDAVILPYLNATTVGDLSDLHIEKLGNLIDLLVSHKPFDIICIHDEFKCHPNNCNQMRRHYIELFAELAESTILDDIFMQVCGHKPTYQNKSAELPALIRQSEYALS